VQIDTFGSSFDTILTVWRGNELAKLVEVATGDDFGGELHSAVFPEVTAGVTYRIAVYGWPSSYGSIALQVSPDLTSRITGRVTGPDGSTPLGGIEVAAYRWFPENVGQSGTWDQVADGVTESDGRYTIAELLSGVYRIEFNDFDGLHAVEVYDNADWIEDGRDVVVGTAATLSGINASLATAAQITGRVTGPDGSTPLEDIDVTAFRLNSSAGFAFWDKVANTQTGADGRYVLRGLSGGTYRVRVDDWNGNFVSETYDNVTALELGRDIVVAASATASGIDVSLESASWITGRVTGPDGRTPLEDIDVTAFRWVQPAGGGYWEHISDGYTDEDGNYGIGRLPAGTYRVRFDDNVNKAYVSEVYDDVADIGDGRDIVAGAAARVYGIDASLAMPDAGSGPPAPLLQLSNHGSRWELEYRPSAMSGVAMLHASPSLADLNATNARLLSVPAGSGPLLLDVGSLVSGPQTFFSVTEYHDLKVEDFVPFPDDPGIDDSPPLYDFESVTALGYPLQKDTNIQVSLRLLAGSTGQPVTADGSVVLGLVKADGSPVAFGYALNPPSLPLIGGVVNGSITLTTESQLDGVYLSVVDVIVPSRRVGGRNGSPAPTTGRTVIGFKHKKVTEYRSTATGWRHPLGFVVPIAGSFGEWRSEKVKAGPTRGSSMVGDRPGQPHLGIDLAVAAGTKVYPVKRGVVSHRGSLGSLGGYMVVVHGDGTASRYLHVDPIRQCHEIVETDMPIATVANIEKRHLHLELRFNAQPTAAAGDYLRFGAYPGFAVDPGLENDRFDTPLIRKGENDRRDPQIKALYLWDADPKAAAFDAASPGRIRLQRNGIVVAQIVDAESGNLNPCSFAFASEDPQSGHLGPAAQQFDYGSQTEVERLFQNHVNSFRDFGYVRRVGNVLPSAAMYHYWFRWNTAAYAPHPLGPRRFEIKAADRAGNGTSRIFTFGPKLAAPDEFVPSYSAEGNSLEIKLRNFMGPFPAEMQGTPEDVIRISLITTGLRSWTAAFEDGDPAKLSRELKLTGHDEPSERNVVLRIKPMSAGNPAPTTPEELIVRAVSGVYPDIAHEVSVKISPNSAFVLIPGGTFQMGDSLGDGWVDERPVRTVYVSEFFLQAYETTMAEWHSVRTWALAHGYAIGSGSGNGASHPVVGVTWYDVVKWCNARSEKEGLVPCYYTNAARTAVYRSGEVDVTNDQVLWTANGYRLTTEAEWEKAARGGLAGRRFPWGDTITHSQANYYSYAELFYDTSPTRGYHPAYQAGDNPYTSPVRSFTPNGYGLYDMAGNVNEWCWDWWNNEYYASGANHEPRGPATGSYRVGRGGSWYDGAGVCRVSYRNWGNPSYGGTSLGIRPARGR
jgi:formylglycine-generating enzyme required for sulfatase activity/murein DD-endopeptidase MepM/ murein hydrolase activator NlpD